MTKEEYESDVKRIDKLHHQWEEEHHWNKTQSSFKTQKALWLITVLLLSLWIIFK